MHRTLAKRQELETQGSGGAPQPAESTADASQLGGLPTVRLRAAASPAPEIPGRLGAHRAGFATGSAQYGFSTAGKTKGGSNARLVLSMDLSSWRR